jgi:hypothetical protein
MQYMEANYNPGPNDSCPDSVLRFILETLNTEMLERKETVTWFLSDIFETKVAAKTVCER